MQLYEGGNSEAFVLLFERFEIRIFAFLNRRLSAKQRHLASDLFQTTWLKVHQARSTFKPSEKFSNWIFTIAINTLRDHVARKQFQVETELQREEMIASHEPNPEELLLKADELNELGELLAELTVPQREVLLLIDGEGFSSNEAGEMLGISEDAARQLVTRARHQVRKLRALNV